MRLSTLYSLFRLMDPLLVLRLNRQAKGFFRLCFLAGALEAEILESLARGPMNLDELCQGFPEDPYFRQGLRAWLDMGVTLGELSLDSRGYRLSGACAKGLAKKRNDPAAAFLLEMLRLDHRLLTDTPRRMKRGEAWTLDDQDGTIIARSSRLAEPFIKEAIRRHFPKKGKLRLLEVGCGSGIYMDYAASLNPELIALGLELQPDVAEEARKNLARWGSGGRTEVTDADVRELAPRPLFDLASLYNNIYYFEEGERDDLLRRLCGFLKPGGKLLAVTACRGAGPVLSILDFWGEITRGCGPLPRPEDMKESMLRAGFSAVRAKSLIPGESYWSFCGVKGP